MKLTDDQRNAQVAETRSLLALLQDIKAQADFAINETLRRLADVQMSAAKSRAVVGDSN